MKVCPITYDLLDEKVKSGGKSKYSKRGLRSLSSSLAQLKDLSLTAKEQRRQAEVFATKLSIQGVQPKLSAALSVKDSSFELVEKGGKYILKPQVERFRHLPENEDLTMRLASEVGIKVPLHGLVYSKDGSLTYFIRRFDREGQKRKLHVEDFAQLRGESRDTKYDSSMEKVAEVLDLFCTFPAVEKLDLFKRTLFSFLVGNEDMHLKNFSLIVQDAKVGFSPAYDLVNSTLVLANPTSELALPIRGKRNRLSRADLVDYFGHERLKLNQAACDSVLSGIKTAQRAWDELIKKSFLPKESRQAYREIVEERLARLGLRERK